MTTNILTENGIESNTITLNTGTSEMLRVARDGFYVRGKRVNQDDKEAEIVYNAFSQWLTWTTLNRDFK
jgi:hypothetical protein